MTNTHTIFIFLFLMFLISCKGENKIVSEKWDNGKTKIEKNWIDEESNSFKEFAYYENGQIRLEEDYIEGKLCVYKAYYKTGEISAIVMYQNEVSIFGAEYYKNGQLMGNIPTNLDGKTNGLATYYYENGSLRGEQVFQNGKPIGNSKKYEQSGKLTSQ